MHEIPIARVAPALLLGAALAIFLGAQAAGIATAQADELREPVRILAAGEPIDVTTGHAAPYVLDFDGDGVRDLLVGEFGDGKFPDDELPANLAARWKKGGHFVHGRVRIYRNHGTDVEPRFGSFEYLQAGGEVASIPIT